MSGGNRKIRMARLDGPSMSDGRRHSAAPPGMEEIHRATEKKNNVRLFPLGMTPGPSSLTDIHLLAGGMIFFRNRISALDILCFKPI